MSLKSYFRHPIPRSGGFGPYRRPGPVAHIPATLLLLLPAWLLGANHPLGLPLLLLQCIPALYLGRDIAILAHYFAPLTFILYFAGLACLTVLLPTLIEIQNHPPAHAAYLPPLILGFILIIRASVIKK